MEATTKQGNATATTTEVTIKDGELVKTIQELSNLELSLVGGGLGAVSFY